MMVMMMTMMMMMMMRRPSSLRVRAKPRHLPYIFNCIYIYIYICTDVDTSDGSFVSSILISDLGHGEGLQANSGQVV